MLFRRRRLVIALGAGALVPLASFSQQPPAGKIWRIGILTAYPQLTAQGGGYYGSFVAGLRDLGYVDGRNIAIEWRFANGAYDRLPGLAAELANLKVDVIVTSGTPGVRAGQLATATIPIVTVSFADPVGSGLVASLARPGGNITGLSNMGEDIVIKRLELLSVAAPKATRIAVLVNPKNPYTKQVLPILDAAAKKLNRQIQIINASAIGEIEDGFSLMVREHAGALLIQDESFLNGHMVQIAELAARQKLPSIHTGRQYAEAGGLMSYGLNVADSYRRIAAYVDKIFKGAKPGDLPIEQPTKIELVFNMKTAKALGIKIPDTLLLRADRVIE